VASDIPPESLESFLGRLADGSPTPGGGAAVAMTAAAAAALVSMVTRVTLAKSSSGPALVEIARAADRCRATVLALMDEDAKAYGAVIEALRASGGLVDSAAVAALIRATATPLDVARTSRTVLELAADVAPTVRPSARSDLSVAVTLAAAALEGATRTARENLEHIVDGGFVATVDRELAELLAAGDKACDRARAALGGSS
jgi:formiminotetrahydrofolate cyclodeaminase